MSSTWGRCDEWNAAIAEIVFCPEMEGRPVYLDLEDEVLASLWERTSRAGQSPAEDLAAAVAATLHLGGDPFRIFRAVLVRLGRWRQTDRRSTPPVLALLAVLSLSAEAMAAGEGMAAHNYYGRLFQLLGIEDEGGKRRLENGYRAIAVELWAALNEWLDILEGARGTPTAYSVGPHRYVGLPLSQALVRADDRRRLEGMFWSVGLGPGEAVGVADMIRLLDHWIGDEHSGAGSNLRRLWQRGGPDLRERVAEVVVLELEAWQGTEAVVDPTAHRSGNTRIVAWLETFLTQRLKLSLDVHLLSSGLKMLEVSGPGAREPVVADVPTRHIDGGWLRLLIDSSLDEQSLIAVPLQLRDTETGERASHLPRALYVLAKDEATQLFAERERVVLGLDCMILAVTRLSGDIGEALDQIARPGWTSWSAQDLSGLPAGWTLFAKVQVMAVPAPSEKDRYSKELNALLPVSMSQLSISGGLMLPGVVRKWSSLNPPEVRALSEGSLPLTVAVECLRTTAGQVLPAVVERTTDSGAAVLSLADFNLPDGDYEVAARAEGASTAQRRTLRLRSADSPAVHSAGEETLAHYDADPLWPLAARAATGLDDRQVCRGAQVDGWTELPEDSWRPPPPRWRSIRKETRSQRTVLGPRIEFGVISKDSCLLTGAHYIDLPPTGPGHTSAITVPGTCRNCGLVKRYPATWARARWASSRSRTAQPARHLQLTDLSSLPAVGSPIGHMAAAVLDGLFHLGEGSPAHLETLAEQIEASPLFVSEYVRAIEALGHIEVARDRANLRPVSWQATPVTFAETTDGSYVIVGRMTPRLRASISMGAELLDGSLEEEPMAWCLVRWRLLGLGPSQVAELVEFVQAETKVRPVVAHHAAEHLASVLPPFSRVLAALPVGRPPAARRTSQWGPATASWVETRRIDHAGAYRFEGFTTSYGLRSEDQIEQGTMSIGDARIVKYGVACTTGLALAEYYEDTGTLEVPLGADLPGLYGRAAVLASGQLPVRDRTGSATVYTGMTAPLAYALLRKFHE